MNRAISLESLDLESWNKLLRAGTALCRELARSGTDRTIVDHLIRCVMRFDSGSPDLWLAIDLRVALEAKAAETGNALMRWAAELLASLIERQLELCPLYVEH